MDTIEILMQYHGEVNKIYKEEPSICLAHIKCSNLFHNYVQKFKMMVHAGTMSSEEYDELTDKMLVINVTKCM